MSMSFAPSWALSPQTIVRIDRFIEKSVTVGGIPGASLVIVRIIRSPTARDTALPTSSARFR